MKFLTNLDPNEVSTVPTGANRKRFLLLKEDLGSSERNALADSSFAIPDERKFPIHNISHARNALARASGTKYDDRVKAAVYRKYPSLKPDTKKVGKMTEVLEGILKAFGKKDQGGDEDAINEKLDGLSPAAQTAARAIGRIAAPHADELTSEHVAAVLEDAGIDGAQTTGESQGGSKQMKKEHMQAAKEAGEKAYKAHMEKLGYQKYPKGELQMKEVTDNAEKGADEDDDEKAEKAKKEKEKAEKEARVNKDAILKEDGTINWDAVPAEQRPVLQAIAKMQVAAEARATQAEAKAANTEKVLKEHREAVRKEEIARNAKEFKNLKTEDVQKTLELADNVSSEEYDRVLKMFQAQDAKLAQSALFTEIGNAGMSDGSVSAWAKIEKAAEGIVAKSSEKITKEMAISDFLMTDEGQKLYAQHQASRPNGI